MKLKILCLGLTPFGPITSFDTSNYPYNLTHSLITSMPIDTTPTQTNYYNSTVVDWVTPIDGVSGLPELKPVWEYLLCFDPLSTEIANRETSSGIIIFPNSAYESIFIETQRSNHISKLEIYNIQGLCIHSSPFTSNIDCSQLVCGIYTVRVFVNDKVYFTIFLKL